MRNLNQETTNHLQRAKANIENALKVLDESVELYSFQAIGFLLRDSIKTLDRQIEALGKMGPVMTPIEVKPKAEPQSLTQITHEVDEDEIFTLNDLRQFLKDRDQRLKHKSLWNSIVPDTEKQ